MTTPSKPPNRWRHLILVSAALALLLGALPTLAATQAAAQSGQVLTTDTAAPAFEKVGLSMDTVNDCVVEDPVYDVIYACQYRGMMRSFDNGVTWERAGEFDTSPIAPEGGLERRHYISADVDSIGRVFVGNQGTSGGWSTHLTGQVRMSVDQGSTWQTITPPSLHATNAGVDSRVRDIIVDRDNADASRKDIVYYCAGNRVYRSWSDQHEVDPAWGPLDADNNPVGLQEEIKWDAITPNTGAAGAGPNGGLGPASNKCRQMLIHNGSLFVATRDGIWRSDNYDLPLSPYGPPDSSPINWVLITPSTLNNVGIESIAFDPDDRLFASTEWKRNFDEGLWQSSDPVAATPTFQRLHGRLGSRLAVTASGALLTGSIADIWHTPDPTVAPTTRSPIQTAQVFDFEELADGTLLAATWGAGILRSTDDGQTWNGSNDGQHFFPAPRVVDQSGRVYAKSGTGVLYSDDEGQNFHHCGRFPTSVSFLRESRVSSMAMHDGSLFVLMHHPSGLTGLWSSTDQCQSFAQVSQSPNGQGGRFLTVTANGTMLAVFGHPGDLYRSTDLGLTWTAITNSVPAPAGDSPDSGPVVGVLPINDIELAPDGTIWLLGDYNDVYRSADDGVTWQAPMRLETGAAHIGYVPDGVFGFAANGDVFIGGIRGIYKVVSGTSVVEPLALNATTNALFQFHSISIDSTGRIYAAAGGSSENSLLGIYVSEDHGETWVHEPNSLRDRLHANVWVNPQTDTVLVSTWGDGLSRREAPPVTCNGQAATIVGTPGDDPYIRATEGNDVIHGLGGDDTIYGLGGDDIICGGDGNDSLVGDAGHGPDGVDLLFGGDGDDHVFAGGGDDIAHGGNGDDKLHGLDGNDRLFGDAGNDELHGNAGDDFADGGDGNDRLHGYGGNDTLIGGRGNDYAKGGTGSDSINGQAGNDELHGSEHNDRIWGSWGDDIIRGDGGTDTLNGNQGADTLIGGHGNDRLWGGDGHDILDGQWGNDRLGGQNGDDSLNGGPGTDTLGGGNGTDSCVNGERLWSCEDPTTTAALINWTPGGGTWQAHAKDGGGRAAGVQWGVNSDVALTGDINADGSDDFIIYRPSNARWYAKDSDGAVLLNHLVFGNPASISQALVGDVDGDNDDDLVIWDETLGRFFTTDSDGTAGVGAIPLGAAGDVALLGDTNGDGKDDFIVWRPSDGKWFAMDSDGLTSHVNGLQWGRKGDVPLIGDVNGDGKDDFVVWRPANGRWYAREAGGTVLSPAVQWGANGDLPVIGDLNEDGKDDFLIWRPSNQRWYARGADNTVLLNNIQVGTASDKPLFGVLQR